MAVSTIVIHPLDWGNATIYTKINDTVVKNVAIGGGKTGQAGWGILGAGQPLILGVALNGCFLGTGSSSGGSITPPNIDPPFPPVPTIFSTGDIYARNNLNQSLVMVHGDDFVFDIAVVINGAAFDLTGCTLRMTAKWNPYDSDVNAVFALTSLVGGTINITNYTGGLATITVPAATTLNLPEHRLQLYYDIQVFTATSQTKTVARGTLVILPDISRTTP